MTGQLDAHVLDAGWRWRALRIDLKRQILVAANIFRYWFPVPVRQTMYIQRYAGVLIRRGQYIAKRCGLVWIIRLEPDQLRRVVGSRLTREFSGIAGILRTGKYLDPAAASAHGSLVFDCIKV